ncbi:flagellar protein FlgN [Marinobacter salinisoli]|uniref:Flagellar protein FlgN n=1 Tax=Marinobacter salinisoli TaxID=2769486 RepID=A0ABX7MP09_9GAMM|nr:flagellar protein FlgN [Marinobacter salinisoli]QSP94035.1 flagellar protein FlgN [Marinobacter salinisoli]
MAATDDLKHLLNEDVRQLDELADLLANEKACLASSDVPALQPLTEAKSRLLGEIRERAKKKIHLLVAMGYTPQHGAPSQFIQAAGMAEIFELWKQADTQMKACQALNQRNGRVVGHLQKRLGRLKDILRGTATQPKLYGERGERTSVSSRTVLASA